MLSSTSAVAKLATRFWASTRPAAAPWALKSADAADVASLLTLTENVAVLLAIADRAAPGQLAPATGSGARDHVLELLSFIATELHARVLGPWLGAKDSGLPVEAYAEHLRGLLKPRFDYLEAQIEGEDGYLAGPLFTVADAYLVPMLTWARHLRVRLDDWPKLAGLHTRLQSRPAVQQAMKAELKEYRPG